MSYRTHRVPTPFSHGEQSPALDGVIRNANGRIHVSNDTESITNYAVKMDADFFAFWTSEHESDNDVYVIESDTVSKAFCCFSLLMRCRENGLETVPKFDNYRQFYAVE